MAPKKTYCGETTPDEEKQMSLTRSALDVTLTDFNQHLFLGCVMGRSPRLATSTGRISRDLIGLAREFALARC